MIDRFTEVTTKSWGSRIVSSFIGVLIGFVLFIASFPVIIWNESRSVDRIRTLAEGRSIVVAVEAQSVDPANEGRLIHLSGRAETSDVLKDEAFGVQENALQLTRKVEMLQWEEKSKSKTETNGGGSETTETTYTYSKIWSDREISSSSFKHGVGHENPQMPAFRSAGFIASDVHVGAFGLGGDFVGQINGFEGYPVSDKNLGALDPSVRNGLIVSSGMFFRGEPSNPKVGDVRISFQIVRPQDVSAIGKQYNGTLQRYATKNGSISLLKAGTVPAEDMFAAAESENKVSTWLTRLFGFGMMALSLSLILGPLSVLTSVIPIFGSLLAAGTRAVSFVVALVLTLVTIAIAWIAFRPLIGLTLLAAGAFILLGGIRWLRGRAADAAAPREAPVQFGRPAA